LLEKYPDVKNMSLAQVISMFKSLGKPSVDSRKWTPNATVLTLRRFAAAQCLMGTIGCEMAYCATNVCRNKEDNHLLHHGQNRCTKEDTLRANIPVKEPEEPKTKDESRLNMAMDTKVNSTANLTHESKTANLTHESKTVNLTHESKTVNLTNESKTANLTQPAEVGLEEEGEDEDESTDETEDEEEAEEEEEADTDEGVSANRALVFDQKCNITRAQKDFERPIELVVTENKAYDLPGYGHGARCYFGNSGGRLTTCSSAYQNKNFHLYTSVRGEAQFNTVESSRKNGSALAIKYDNRTLLTYSRVDTVTDVICDALGWMELPPSLVGNFQEFEKKVNMECANLLKEHPDVKNMSMIEATTMLAKIAPPAMEEQTWLLSQRRHTFRRFAAAQCLVGTVGCEMAHCAVNHCKKNVGQETFFIGHGSVQCTELTGVSYSQKELDSEEADVDSEETTESDSEEDSIKEEDEDEAGDEGWMKMEDLDEAGDEAGDEDWIKMEDLEKAGEETLAEVFSAVPTKCGLIADDYKPTDVVYDVVEQTHDFSKRACLFSKFSKGYGACAAARAKRHFPLYSHGQGLLMQPHVKDQRRLKLTYNWGMRMFYTTKHHDPMSDIVCVTTGWIRLPKAKVTNFRAWEQLERRECDRLITAHPEVKEMSLDDLNHANTRLSLGYTADLHEWNSEATVHIMKRRAAMQCLLGVAGCSMADCATNYCHLKRNVIGHGIRDCGAIPIMDRKY
jgi:hypothetical protein